MNDQRDLWDKAHKDGDISHYSNAPTEFANEVVKIVKPSSSILELGCGVGNDSVAFANAGHQVTATDFSEIAITKNQQRYADIPGLKFEVLDMNEPFKLRDDTFDVVYARLSLHYLTDDITRKIISEIHRVLKPASLLCFVCKSTKDLLYGKGDRIEKDMYEYKGHVRHFFSEQYARLLLEKNFKIERLETGDDKFYGRESSFVKVFAQKCIP